MKNENLNVPQHIAIILDGNGRWAKAKGMPRSYGHKVGADNLEDMCEIMDAHGVKYFTVYAFSTENWNRPSDEVSTLMGLLRTHMKSCIKRANKNNMRVRMIGDITRLDSDLQKSILDLEEATKDNTGLQYTIALNYGSRDELRRGITELAKEVAEGKVKPEDITEDMITSKLDTAGIPDPDLIIRTSGEQRLSNFLLWQAAYSEFYFTDVHWPDFKTEALEDAIENYSKRNRRFGAIKEE